MKRLFLLFILSFLFILQGCVGGVSENKAILKQGEAGSLIVEGVGFVGSFPVGDIAQVTVRLTNIGRLPISLEKIEMEQKSVVRFAGSAFPGVGGTCTSQTQILNTNESCTMVFQIFSSTPAVFKEKITIYYANGIDHLNYQGYFQGLVGNPAQLVVRNDIKSIHFGIVEPGETKSYLIEVENQGELPAVDVQAFFADEGDSNQVFFFNGAQKTYPGTNGTCGNAVAPKEICKIELQTLPLVAGVESHSSLKIAYKNPLNAQTTSLDLAVTSAELKAYVSVIETFQVVGEVLNGALEEDRKTLTWTVRNDGLIKATDILLHNPNDVPLDFVSSTCPVLGLEPNQTCSMVYKFNPNYPLPLPSPLSFPIVLKNQLISFSYNDGKYPTPAITNEVEITGKILDEAHLVFYENSDSAKPFLTNQSLNAINVTWDGSQWMGNIGAANNPARNIKMSNLGIGSRVEAKEIQIELLDNDGDLSLFCSGSGGMVCAKKLNAGSFEIINLNFNPAYRIPFEAAHEYKLKVTYNTGKRIKTYEVKIPTTRKANPIISFGYDTTSVTSGNTVSFDAVLPGMVTSKTIFFRNDGPLPYSVDFIFEELSTLSYFDIPDGTNGCLTAEIANGQTCSFIIHFTKNIYDEDGNETQLQSIRFSNGLDPASSAYESYQIKFSASLKTYGYYATVAGQETVNFGSIPWSNLPSLEKRFALPATVEKKGEWGISHYEYELVGADKDLFTITYSISSPTKPQDSDYYSGPPSFIVTLKSPQNSGEMSRILNAQLVVRYYGRNPANFVSYLPGDEMVVNLTATIQNEAYYVSALSIYNFGPTPVGVPETQEITINNAGQLKSSSLVTMDLIVVGGGTPSKLSDYKVLSSTCESYTKVSEVKFLFNINAGSSCKFLIEFTPTAGGSNNLTGQLNYVTIDGQTRTSSFALNGRSNAPAFLSFTPAPDKFGTYTSFGEYKIGTGTEKTFTLANASGVDGSPGQILTLALVPLTTSGCGEITSDKIQPEWKDYIQANGTNADYKITENNCSGKTLLPFEDELNVDPSKVMSCSVKVSFNPEKIDRLIGSCLKVTFKRYAGDPLEGASSTRFLGYGVPPSAFFNGWRGVFAEGETDSHSYKVKLQWNPVTIESGLGEVLGYNIYKKKSKDSIFISAPVNPVRVTDLKAGNFYEYIENADNLAGDYEQPLAGEVYDYYIKPIVKFTGLSTEYLLNTQEADRLTKVIVPLPYTVLLNRRNINTIVCTELLGKAYADLARGAHNSCTYTGYGSNGGIFDLEKDLIVDRYENIELSGAPTNGPGYRPKLYTKLTDAQESCTKQKASVEGANIFDKKKRLIKRMEYMILGMGQQVTGCNVSSDILSETGRNTCLSKFGAEDLIGNAWDFVDTKMTRGPVATDLWTLAEDFGVGANRKWPTTLKLLDFTNEVNFYDVSTFMTKRTPHTSWSPCYHRLFGLPMTDVAGLCNQGAVGISSVLPTMGFNSLYNYVYTLENTSEIFDTYEGTRYLMAGGAYDSRNLFGIDSNIHSMYWNNESIESIIHGNQQKNWEGGSARCILEVNY